MTLSSLLSRKKTCWLDPECSTGKECMKIQSYICFEAKGPALDRFLELAPRIQELLDNHRDDRLTSCEEHPRTISYHIWMVGTQRTNTKPTVIICSKSKAQRRAAKDVIRKSGLLDEFPGAELKTLDKRPAIPRAEDDDSFMADEGSDNALYIIGRPKNPCGALLTLGSQQKATLGGIIMIDGEYYGITAFHRQYRGVQEPESPDDDEAIAFDDDSDTEQQPIDIMSQGSISSGEDSFGTSASADTSESVGETTISRKEWPRDLAQVEAGSSDCDMDDPTDGQERRKIATLQPDHEIGDLDYEIFPIGKIEYQVPNVVIVPAEAGTVQQAIYPAQITSDRSENDVWAVTGTSGPVKGKMLQSPHYIKMAGARIFQELWQVQLERRTKPGDSGAWVLDAANGNLYGHIVAANPVTSLAFIIPAFKIRNDIKRRYGREPVLPTLSGCSVVEDIVLQSTEAPIQATITENISRAQNPEKNFGFTPYSIKAAESSHSTSASLRRGASSVWSKDHDHLLMNARKHGVNWAAIQQAHSPDKTPNSGRKRHERLIERGNIDDWDGQKLECVATEYMNIRKQMWSMLADRCGENWQLIESKCLEKGLKNLQTAARSASKNSPLSSSLEASGMKSSYPAGAIATDKKNITTGLERYGDFDADNDSGEDRIVWDRDGDAWSLN